MFGNLLSEVSPINSIIRRSRIDTIMKKYLYMSSSSRFFRNAELQPVSGVHFPTLYSLPRPPPFHILRAFLYYLSLSNRLRSTEQRSNAKTYFTSSCQCLGNLYQFKHRQPKLNLCCRLRIIRVCMRKQQIF